MPHHSHCLSSEEPSGTVMHMCLTILLFSYWAILAVDQTHQRVFILTVQTAIKFPQLYVSSLFFFFLTSSHFRSCLLALQEHYSEALGHFLSIIICIRGHAQCSDQDIRCLWGNAISDISFVEQKIFDFAKT